MSDPDGERSVVALQDNPPAILLEDGPLIAVNKPAGLLTQGVPGGIPTIESWLKAYLKEKYGKPGNVYLGIPHRLDRPVSGVMVFARNSKAAARLAEQFQQRTVRKQYLCVTNGIPDPPAAHLTDWLLKDAEAAHVTVVAEESAAAKRAELSYEVLAALGSQALVRVELHTGRMHQIRVQLAHRGWCIIGDRQYGAPGEISSLDDRPPRPASIALHAHRLELSHPVRYDRLSLTASIPSTWTALGVPDELRHALD